MIRFISDLARIASFTENLLYLLGRSLQRRAIRNGVLVGMAYGSALLGVRLAASTPLTPQQITGLLAAAFASYPLGVFLVMLAGFLSRDNVDTAHAGQLDLMGDYKRVAMREHLQRLWNEVFAYEAALQPDVHHAINSRQALHRLRDALFGALDGLPTSLRRELVEEGVGRERLVEHILASQPRERRLENTRETFVLTGLYALNTPLPQRVQEMECGFDLSVLEKWYRRGLFTQEDELLRDFATDLSMARMRHLALPPWRDTLSRFLGASYSPSFWYASTMRKLTLTLGKNIRQLNAQAELSGHPPYFGAQHLLWPSTALLQDLPGRFGEPSGQALRKKLIQTRRRFIHAIFSAQPQAAHRLLGRMFEKQWRQVFLLRLRWDAEYSAGELRQTPASDLALWVQLTGRPCPAWTKAATRHIRKNHAEPFSRLRDSGCTLPQEVEALRALRIAWHLDLGGLQRLTRIDRPDARLQATCDRLTHEATRISAGLVRLRVFHSLVRIQLQLYTELVDKLAT